MRSKEGYGRHDHITYEELYFQHWVNGKNSSECADYFDVSKSTIWERVGEWDMPTRGAGPPRKYNVSLQSIIYFYYIKLMTWKEISEVFGCSENNIAYNFYKYDLPARDRSKIHRKYDDVLTETFLKREYVEKERSTVDIADEVGCSTKTMSDYLGRHGIEARNHKIAEQTDFPNFHPAYNEEACPVIDLFGRRFGFDFNHAMNGGEFSVPNTRYWVDGYDENQNVVIEYYENKGHSTQSEIRRDKERREGIMNELGCLFIEIKESGKSKITLPPQSHAPVYQRENSRGS